MKAMCFVLGVAATVSMAFIWPIYYGVVLAYLVLRFTIAIVREEEDWPPAAVLFLILVGPFSGLLEIIEWYEINEYIAYIKRKELE